MLPCSNFNQVEVGGPNRERIFYTRKSVKVKAERKMVLVEKLSEVCFVFAGSMSGLKDKDSAVMEGQDRQRGNACKII